MPRQNGRSAQYGAGAEAEAEADAEVGAEADAEASAEPDVGMGPAPRGARPVTGGAADPLEHPDPVAAAGAAATENLLRCWVRETGLPGPGEDGLLRVPLRATDTALSVPVLHWSATGRHRFGPPRLEGAPEGTAPVDAATLAALIAREAARPCTGAEGADELSGSGDASYPQRPPETAELVGRVTDSLQHTAEFLADRRAHPEAPAGTPPFLDAEQALMLGHPLHPAPKSREGLSESEARSYAPELRGSFALHWMAADPSVLAQDSGWTERGRAVSAEKLARRLAGEEVCARLPQGAVPLPLHPWQARELLHRPTVARLVDQGLLTDLGTGGDAWHPSSSVRTVLRPGSPVMLKLSLALRITNSRRENLRKEALRGLEVHRLLRGGLFAEWQAVHPGFDIVRDPAWLGVDGPDGEPLAGFDTVLRHNPFGGGEDAACVAGLTSPRPWPGAPEGVLRSRLADVVRKLAGRTGRPVAAVAAEWFLRYLESVVRPVLWLDGHAGIALEAHQQNTVVLLDSYGWPCGGRYRDNQGYYFRTSRRAELERRLPAAQLGVASDSFVPDAVVDERFAYYVGINNVFGLIGSFGAEGLADEELLLAAFRRFLEAEARAKGADAGDEGRVSPLPALLLESPVLRCKANLLTRVHGLDELVGPVETQSVYVSVPNPLVS
ncbi:IucA/IucC family protein [Streptomyces sp. ODS28]|uniref:IucA/IucC family protein n=1 Tax=Streptomyces sp. ODS28 TaxID=3136688 RepID=UPI0031EBA22B